MAKPTTPIPSYATDATFTSGIETGLAPTLAMSGAEVTQGVKPGKLVARKFNWLVKLIVDWVRHIEGSRPDFVAGDSVYQEGNVTLNCAPGVGLALTGGPSTDFSVDRACTFTQVATFTEKVHCEDELEVDGLLNVDGSGDIYGGLIVRDTFEPIGNIAPLVQEVTLTGSDDYVLNGFGMTIVMPASTGTGRLRLPSVNSASPKYQFTVINTLATGVGVEDFGGVSFMGLSGASLNVFHWTGSSWAWVTVAGSANVYTPT